MWPWKPVSLGAALALGALGLWGPAPAWAEPADIADNEVPDGLSAEWENSLSEDLVEMWITRHDHQMWITHLGGEEWDADEGIVLETDILFSPNEWELPENAGAKITELVEEIPQGASVVVHGHTDSNPVNQQLYDFDNQELSENRAQAVADALANERSDLEMTVEGFGEAEPAVPEDPDDPSTYAENRRVEIRPAD